MFLAVAWLVPAGLYDGAESLRSTLFAFPLILVVFAVPTTVLLCVLRAVARKLPPPYFRVTAVLLLLPAAGPVFAVPSPLAIALQLFIQVLYGLVVRRPPGARSLCQ
jgi:hypothetical protein